MNTTAQAIQPVSKGKLLKATGIALAIALILLFVAILPAEYGIDPLGAGKALGLTSLAASGEGAAASPSAPAAAGPELAAPTMKGTFVDQPKAYKVDSRELKLDQGEGMEIKYHMNKGAGMVYSWTVSPAQKVFYEFHGEPDVKPAGAGEDYYVSYDLDDKVGKTEYHGSFTAPDTGIQGWFWENQTGAPVTIKLATAGFYDYILQNKHDQKTKLQPSDPK
jgi:hypothetical protein